MSTERNTEPTLPGQQFPTLPSQIQLEVDDKVLNSRLFLRLSPFPKDFKRIDLEYALMAICQILHETELSTSTIKDEPSDIRNIVERMSADRVEEFKNLIEKATRTNSCMDLIDQRKHDQ